MFIELADQGEGGDRREGSTVKGTRLHTMQRTLCPLVDVQATAISAASSANQGPGQRRVFGSVTLKKAELRWRIPAGPATSSPAECEGVR